MTRASGALFSPGELQFSVKPEDSQRGWTQSINRESGSRFHCRGWFPEDFSVHLLEGRGSCLVGRHRVAKINWARNLFICWERVLQTIYTPSARRP